MTSRCRTCGRVNYKSKRAAENAVTKSYHGRGVVHRCGSMWHVDVVGEETKGGRPDRWTRVEWDAATMTLWARTRDRCELATCGESLGNQVERHHRQRRQVGGDRLSNLVLLHPRCHQWAHAHPEEARRLGVIVSAHDHDPAEVPLTLATGERVLLDDEGGRLPAPGEDAPESVSV